ncbi:hypothetical protein [Gluconacetobacter takamatsuzukensis]|nr:hypothetical protein [Gluconacetobacter takamatsuzukensis]
MDTSLDRRLWARRQPAGSVMGISRKILYSQKLGSRRKKVLPKR